MMSIRFACRCLTLALASATASSSAPGQLNTRRVLEVNPPRAIRVGQTVVLSVRGAPAGAQYKYVAKMTTTGGGDSPGVKGCQDTWSLGSGASVKWTPASGSYRLTAYGPNSRADTDTLSLTHIVRPRPVMLASSQTPAQPSGVTLTLRTDDLGPGHDYGWWMQYSYETGGGPAQNRIARSQPWAKQTNGPFATHPTPVPSSSNIKARVSIYRGNPCEVIAAGTKGNP